VNLSIVVYVVTKHSKVMGTHRSFAVFDTGIYSKSIRRAVEEKRKHVFGPISSAVPNENSVWRAGGFSITWSRHSRREVRAEK
jgi:hypothetical protein